MTTDYRPIDCDQHSILELLAMRRTPVVCHAVDEAGGTLCLEGVVHDLLTRDGGEYLVLRDGQGHAVSVRLDRLGALLSPTGEPLWRQESVNLDWRN